PSEAQWRDWVHDGALATMRAYAYTRLGQAQVAGQATDRWNAEPRDEAPYRFGYDSWVDQERGIPLRIQVDEAPGRPWYAMQYEALEYDAPIAKERFTAEFPQGATVIEWDLAAEGVSLED